MALQVGRLLGQLVAARLEADQALAQARVLGDLSDDDFVARNLSKWLA